MTAANILEQRLPDCKSSAESIGKDPSSWTPCALLEVTQMHHFEKQNSKPLNQYQSYFN
jgi:hypothetical protein